MQGPKFRIGKFSNSQVFLKTGQRFYLDLNNLPGNESRVFLPHPEIFKSVKPQTNILIDDGKIQLSVNKVSSNQIETEVINGGKISNHKGVNIPKVFIKTSSLTEKIKKILNSV